MRINHQTLCENFCNTCTHNPVCINKVGYGEALNAISQLLIQDRFNRPEFDGLKIIEECMYYKREIPMRKTPDIGETAVSLGEKGKELFGSVMDRFKSR